MLLSKDKFWILGLIFIFFSIYGTSAQDCANNATVAVECQFDEGNTCVDDDNFGHFCVCANIGYQHGANNNKTCEEIACDDVDSELLARVCGQMVETCDGKILDRECNCNDESYRSNDGKYCFEAQCAADDDFQKNCGKGNKCYGTKNDYICECNALGYKRSDKNVKHCSLMMDDELQPPTDYCGKGALNVTGNILDLICTCDQANGFYPAPDEQSCIPLGCFLNPDMQDNCGLENSCVGSKDNYTCICNDKTYRADPDDSKNCIKRTCEEVGLDIESVCGAGAIGCNGTIDKPTCYCNETLYFIPSSDGRQCIRSSCKTSPAAAAKCGEGNSCEGSFDHFLCVCDAPGYKYDDATGACELKQCDDPNIDIEAVCGFGGVYCNGTQRNPVCNCNVTKFYHPSPDGSSCVKASCLSSRMVMEACGEENSCVGSEESFICNCDAEGYFLNTTTNQECFLGSCEDENLDYNKVCGVGALNCTGTIETLECECDNANGYFQTADRRSCERVDCQANETMHIECGEGNTCVGSLEDWMCVCSGFGYKSDNSNPKTCKKIMCGDPGVDVETVCGTGAKSCDGHIAKAVCTCDTDKNYVPNEDSSRCIKDSCSSNKDVLKNCGIQNSCSGSYDNYVCVCDAPGYKSMNDTICIEQMCSDDNIDIEKVCGVGAEYCNGTINHRVCSCDEENFFHQSEDRKSCVKATCQSSPIVRMQCGEANSCFGNEESFICNCNAFGYKLNETSNQYCHMVSCEDGDLDPVDMCGEGALYCNGTVKSHMCECDNSEGYVQSPDRMSCIPSDCRGNETMYIQCGTLNKCVGSIDDWRCVCDSPFYTTHDSDIQKCRLLNCSDSEVDPVEVCGIGTLSCSGATMHPTCHCDVSNHFFASEDGTRCVAGSCRTNTTAVTQCGASNACAGSHSEWVCICDGPGYKYDPTDPQNCLLKTCDDDDIDLEEVCGVGARKCTGYQVKPKCECKDEVYYVPNEDRSHCVLASCRANQTAMMLCGDGNDCRGSLSSHVCLCNHPAYKADPSDSRNCLEKTCEDGDFDVISVCGKGALSCKGAMKDLDCECDNTKGYVASPDHMRCLPSDCNGNVTMHKQCGEGNRCAGSLMDWHCICDAVGYEPHPKDNMRCHQITCADADVDPIDVCGMGATSCEGPVINPVCYCDEENYFVPSMDRTSCVKASCISNQTAIDQCGADNSCSGSADNFVCVCHANGYRQDENDNQRCIQSRCDDPGADYVEICGQGGTGCTGTVIDPVCKCDNANHFVPSPDQHSCVLSTCRGNETAMSNCGEQNKCFGSTSSYICVCDAFGYKPNPSNIQECVFQTCEDNELDAVAACGNGALSCKGTLETLMCHCDNSRGYVAGPGYTSCIPADCRANLTMHEQCGDENKCKGSIGDWSCICDGVGSKPDPSDHMRCIPIMCSDADVDLNAVCGVGATNCTGLVTNPICHCDTENYYVQSEDGRSCQPATCHTNKTALMQCGPDNSCIGPPNDFICECNGYGYRKDENDLQRCVPIRCDEGLVDIMSVCGTGSTGCRGEIRSPVCECDHSMHFIPSEDRKSCIEASCRTNDTVRDACGVGNTCFGSTKSWICDCNTPGTLLDPSNVKQCLLATCESGQLDAVSVCGKGALSCKGDLRNLHCTCDNEMGFVAAADGKSCVAADCHGNATMHHQCGDPNTCIGSLTDWVCVCTAPGFKPHPSDPMKCHPIKCGDSDINPVDVCGVGAVSCEGSILDPLCNCDTDDYYITSSDGASCVPASCQTNKTAVAQCGGPNHCVGPADNFICVCDAYGYKLDDNDHQHCVEISCNDPNVHEAICGTGSTGCQGTARNPICECDHTKHFVASSDLRSCVLASCRANDAVMNACGEGNTCFGSLTSHICVCEAYGYKLNPANHRECLEETCEDDNLDPVVVCGKGATGCKGSVNSVQCECDSDMGFYQSSDGMKCVSTSCRQNPESQEKCGDVNECYGNYDDFYCDCSAPGYMANSSDSTMCVKEECDDTMAVDVCGLGALTCSGHKNEPICTCDHTKGYMLSKDMHSCVPMPCTMNPATRGCGYGNTCKGSYFSYVCVCSTAGTMRNINNPRECIDVNCTTDAISVCGEGAIGCEVTDTNNVECQCGEGYHPADDLHSCVLDSCRYNPAALEACGLLNECVGSYKSWKCHCHYPEFTQDPKNHQTCVYGPCMVEQCGSGNAPGSFQLYGESCKGLYNNPICVCQEGYELDLKGGCVPKSCNDAPQPCVNGHCKGTYFQYTCICNKPEYMQDPKNPRQCVPAPCNIQQCGHGFDRGLYIDFAESCTGSYSDPVCQCKEGFSGSDTPKCGPAIDGCKLNKCDPLATCKNLNQDGDVECTCKEGYSGSGLMGECYLDGGLSAWEGTGKCSEVCGTNGMAEVTRYCNNPTPHVNGTDCNVTTPEISSVPCNIFDCTDCVVRKSCECKNLSPIFVDGYSEPDDSLEYFKDLVKDDVSKALNFLKTWREFSQLDLCLKFSRSELGDKVSAIADAEEEIKSMKSGLVSARDTMRKQIDCNINIKKKDQYYGAYEVIIKRHLAIGNILKDLTIIKASVTKYMNHCDETKIGMIRSILDMD